MIDLEKLYINAILFRALYVCCDLGLADVLQEKPMDITQLSNELRCNADGLKRLMRVLIAHEVFKQDTHGYYMNSDFSAKLSKTHPETLLPMLLHEDETRWNALGNLKYSVQTGKPSFDHLYGDDYFLYTKNNPVLSDRFNQAMCFISEQEEDVISKKVNFHGVIADIGGGTGQLINKINQHNVIEHAYLFDLPEVKENFTNSNCTKVPGSFFEKIDIQADIYLLKRVLHDWTDDQALIILKNVVDSMPTGSKLLIFEGIIMDNDSVFLRHIDLLLLSIFGGKERTQAEFESLLNKVNLNVISYKNLTETMFVIECVK